MVAKRLKANIEIVCVCVRARFKSDMKTQRQHTPELDGKEKYNQ